MLTAKVGGDDMGFELVPSLWRAPAAPLDRLEIDDVPAAILAAIVIGIVVRGSGDVSFAIAKAASQAPAPADIARIRHPAPPAEIRGRCTSPSWQGAIVYRGYVGVLNWGSVAVGPERQIMVAMPTFLAFPTPLVSRSEIPPKGT